MANRRMFSKEITNSSEFLMMSQSAQNLYFHFGMNADDDGFCEVFTVMRMTDSKPDDLRALHERAFIYIVDSKVCIVKDWHENNQLRADRYKPSKYLEDPKYRDVYTAIMEDKIKEIDQYKTLLLTGLPLGNQVEPQDSIGKGRIEEIHTQVIEEVSEDGKKPRERTNLAGFQDFRNSYPKKIDMERASATWRKLSTEDRLAALSDIKSREWGNPQYIPLPKNYLEGRRWEDQIDQPKEEVIERFGKVNRR